MTLVLQGGAAYEARIPASLAASALLHAGALALWLGAARKAETTAVQVISNVDILVAQPQARGDLPRPAAPASMKDFLKLALPSVAKPRAPMQVHAPETERPLMKIPDQALRDRGRLKDPAALAPLDMGKKRLDLAQVAQPLEERRAKTLSALPKLEEVGTRRAAPKALQMAALQEEADRRMGLQGLSALSPEPGRRRAPQAAALLPEAAAPPARGGLSRLAEMLPAETGPGLRLEAKAMPVKTALDAAPEAPPKRSAKAAVVVSGGKGSVEIEGPLSNRRILASSVPEFPQWARDQGLIEADVGIRFYVDAAGSVLEEMRVERTSGYGRLDRLVIEHLKRWRFAPAGAGTGNQWGVITFRFVLE